MIFFSPLLDNLTVTFDQAIVSIEAINQSITNQPIYSFYQHNWSANATKKW